MNYSDIRKSGREALRGKWGTAVLAYLIVSLLPTMAEIISMNLGAFSIIGTIGVILLMGPLDYAFKRMMLWANRNKKIESSDVFGGFNEFSRTVMAGVDIYVRTFLWSLLFIVPGIVASYSYSMTYYIMADSPKLSGAEAIEKSKAMMKGHRMELFVLDLSFIGWMILCIFSLGIGYFWLAPYMESSRANFYERLTGSYYGNNTEESEKKVVSEGDVKPYSENEDASVVFSLKCPKCGAKETHTSNNMKCPYCDAEMQEEN